MPLPLARTKIAQFIYESTFAMCPLLPSSWLYIWCGAHGLFPLKRPVPSNGEGHLSGLRGQMSGKNGHLSGKKVDIWAKWKITLFSGLPLYLCVDAPSVSQDKDCSVHLWVNLCHVSSAAFFLALYLMWCPRFVYAQTSCALKRRRTFERIERTNEREKRTFERQKSGHLSEMKNNPFQRITFIPVRWCPFR